MSKAHFLDVYIWQTDLKSHIGILMVNDPNNSSRYPKRRAFGGGKKCHFIRNSMNE